RDASENSFLACRFRRLRRSGLCFRLPRIWISGGFRIDAEVPDVKIHRLFFSHFYKRIFARGERFNGSDFEPSTAKCRDIGLNGMLLLANLPRDLALDVSENALVAFDLDLEDAKAIEGDGSLLRLLRLHRTGRFDSGQLIRTLFHIEVDCGHVDMRLYRGVRAFEFDGLLQACNGIDRATEDVAFGVAVYVACALVKFNELGLTLIVVE